MAAIDPAPPGFEYQAVKNRTRKVMAWLTFISVGFAVMWFAIGAAAAGDQEEKDARCEDANILVDDDWAELCGESVGNAINTGIAYLLGFGSIVLAIVFLLIWVTRPKFKTQIVPISQVKPS